jgi:hypothetical protein
MKSSSEMYRENAANASQLAMEAKEEPSRKRYMRMAAAWLDLAEEQDWLDGQAPPKDVPDDADSQQMKPKA